MKSEKIEDAIFKEFWRSFGTDGLQYFGIAGEHDRPAQTELANIRIQRLNLDFTYLMKDGGFNSYEFQSTNNNESDLRRFRAYESLLSHQTGKDVRTYIFYTGNIKKPNNVFKTGFSTYRVKAICLANYNSEE